MLSLTKAKIRKRRKPIIIRRSEIIGGCICVSVLGKRKFVETFGVNYGDEERYGQIIDHDFFANNIGHSVIQ